MSTSTAAAQHEVEPLGGRAGRRLGLGEDAFERAQGVVQRLCEQLLLGVEVVVQRRFRQAEPQREVGDRGRVVPLLVEESDGDLEDLARGRSRAGRGGRRSRAGPASSRGIPGRPVAAPSGSVVGSVMGSVFHPRGANTRAPWRVGSLSAIITERSVR